MDKKIYISIAILLLVVILAIGGIICFKAYIHSKSPVSQGNPNILKVQYREKISLPDIGNNNKLVNYQAFIKLDTLSLIQEHKLSLDCSNLYFTDLQGVKMPFWLADGQCYSQDSIIWLNIPSIAPHEAKEIYVYYGNEKIASASNYNNVFPKNNQGLVAGYFLGPLVMGKDFSGHGNNGNEDIFTSDYQYWAADGPTFNHWGCGGQDDYRPCDQSDFDSVNFTAPAPKSVDFSQGTIEMWINPYVTVSENYQKIISDSNNNIELGMRPNGDLYFYPAGVGGNNYNLIKSPLSDGTWAHIVVTWDFSTKQVIFYINGKKTVNDIENTPTNWTQKTQIGDNWKIGEFAFAGELSGLRIYSKAFDAQEISDAYVSDNQSGVGPQILLGQEEIVSKVGNLSSPFDNNGDVGKIPVTDNITLTRHYSSPLEGDGANSDSLPMELGNKYDGFLYNNIPVYLVSKNGDKSNVIFGVPSHFDAYAGSPISIKGSFLLSYVGLKINDPTLVKNLQVELGAGAILDNSMGYNTGRKLFDFLVPTAYACGGGNYDKIGDSELDFVKFQSGIYWYALKAPILATSADTIQVYYTPTGTEGFLSIGLADMIFQDQNQNFVRINQAGDQSNNYYARLAPEENGKIEFKQDGQNKTLLLLFENQGKDAFTIDNDSISSIQSIYRETIKSINITDGVGTILDSISMQDIENAILGKTVQPAAQISMSVPLSNLSNNASYWVTLGYDSSNSAMAVDQNQQKVIHWTLGDNPYYYPSSNNWVEGRLYKMDINSQGVISFSEPI